MELSNSAANYVRIQVSDIGQDIKPNSPSSYAFDRFRQADDVSRCSYGSLGLGLATASHLVELHDSTIDVFSEGENIGATLNANLPFSLSSLGDFDSSDMSFAQQPSSNLSDSVLSGLHFLVVDDDVDTRELLTIMLSQYGAVITNVDSAKAALEALAQDKFDLLISDIGMPEEDGYQLIRRVRSDFSSHMHQIPAIALSAYVKEEERAQALAAGFHLHLSKPIEPDELAAAIVRVLNLR